jgi:hypothetical protein
MYTFTTNINTNNNNSIQFFIIYVPSQQLIIIIIIKIINYLNLCAIVFIFNESHTQ